MGYYNKRYISAKMFREVASKQCSLAGGTLNLIYLIYFIIAIGFVAVTSLQIPIKTIETPYGDLQFTINLYPILSLFIFGQFTYSFVFISDKICSSIKLEIVNLFEGFKKYWKVFLLHFVTQLYISLWSLLFVIPGIVKSYSYSMAMYIYKDNPELTYKQCIDRSICMMHGHKWDLFCLQLSYIGWLILCVLTGGILCIWVMPKLQQANYLFYLQVKRIIYS